MADTDQTVARDKRGRFAKGTKPSNGFDKNPNNIASGGYWRYKKNGKSAILDIFKMNIDDFEKLNTLKKDEKTVLDEVLYAKFRSALNGNSKDMEFLFNQAFGQAPRYIEARELHIEAYSKRRPFDQLTKEEVEELLKYNDSS